MSSKQTLSIWSAEPSEGSAEVALNWHRQRNPGVEFVVLPVDHPDVQNAQSGQHFLRSPTHVIGTYVKPSAP